MSYPRKIHALIVEDDLESRRSYEELLHVLSKDGFPIAEPSCACSFDDGIAALNRNAIYHVLILDLGLPDKTRGQVQHGVDPGIELLKRAAQRDSYPIPAVVVVSGRLGGSTALPQLRETLDRSFWFGQFVNKGDPSLVDELTKAFRAALAYAEVGVHVRDTGKRRYPGLSPREDDLLRCCALRQGCLGVDLEWWSAEEAYSVSEGSDIPWKKVLLGQFLLDQGMGLSNPTFFKFEPTDSADLARLSANILSKKLQHVKVVYEAGLSRRGLLVTESVSAARPISLDEFLREDPKTVVPQIGKVITDIVEQLEHLGDTVELQLPVRELLWPHHKLENIKESLRRFAPGGFLPGSDVVGNLTALQTSSRRIWAKLRQCNHGDLHARNVAIDTSFNPVRAFIFDAGPMKREINVRDLAQLEVSMLLFAVPAAGESLVDHCRRLYTSSELVQDITFDSGSSVARNTLAALCEIRRHATRLSSPTVYAVSIFDQALIQIGGLMLQSYRNKIYSLVDAWKLAFLTAEWVRLAAVDAFSGMDPRCEEGAQARAANTSDP